MTNIPKASVIITTFQRSERLQKAIQSVLDQEFPHVEIIVVDDNGSGTKAQSQTETALEHFKSRPNFRYLPMGKNGGACQARNAGAEAASGKYLFFLDDDDVFLPGKIEKQIQLLEANPEYDGCLSAFKRMNEDKSETLADSNFPVVGTFKNFAIQGNFFTPMLCMRKKAFMNSDGFVEIARFQDRYFMLHCLKQKMKFLTMTEPLYIMYEHGQNRITHQSVKKTMASLDTIKMYIYTLKKDFTASEWKQFLGSDSKMRAVLLYNSGMAERLKSIPYWAECFIITKKRVYLKMIFKSLLPK